MSSIKVGYVRIKEPLIQTRQYEVAAWYSEMEVPAGEYPLYLSFSTNFRRPILSTKPISAKVIEQHTPTLYGGVEVGKGSGAGQAGKFDTWSLVLGSDINTTGEVGLEGVEVVSEVPFVRLDPVEPNPGKTPLFKIVVDQEHPEFIALNKSNEVEKAAFDIRANALAFLSVDDTKFYQEKGVLDPSGVGAMMDKGFSKEQIRTGILFHATAAKKIGIKAREMNASIEDVILDLKHFTEKAIAEQGAVRVSDIHAAVIEKIKSDRQQPEVAMAPGM